MTIKQPFLGERREASLANMQRFTLPKLLSTFTSHALLNVINTLLSTFTYTHAHARAYACKHVCMREGGERRKKWSRHYRWPISRPRLAHVRVIASRWSVERHDVQVATRGQRVANSATLRGMSQSGLLNRYLEAPKEVKNATRNSRQSIESFISWSEHKQGVLHG
jgi:hypothetical protein